MAARTDPSDEIAIEATPVSVLFLRFEETKDGFVWEIRCYGAEHAVQRSVEAYRTTTLARATGLAALADIKPPAVRSKRYSVGGDERRVRGHRADYRDD